MSFFNEPKIKRIARNLHSNLEGYYQARYAESLANSEHSENIDSVKVNSWFRKKADFSWRMNLDDPFAVDSDPELKLENSVGQTNHYKFLLDSAQYIINELNADMPNYDTIILMANQIKSKSTIVPSSIGIDSIDLKMTYFSGGNLFTNFFSGVGGLLGAPIMGLASLVLIPAYLTNYSEYCGGPNFSSIPPFICVNPYGK